MSDQPLTFVHGSAVVRVYCDSPEFNAGASSLFQSYLVGHEADAGTILRLESDSKNQWRLSGDGQAGEDFENFESAVIGLEYELSLSLLRGRADIPHLHASGFLIGQASVLVLGNSGSGKSSLALTACGRGRPVFGDDVILVDNEGNLNSFQRLFEVDPPRLAAIGVEPTETPFWLSGSTEAWFDPAGAGGWVNVPSPVDLVVVARYQQPGEPNLRELPSADVLLSLTRSVMDTGLPPEEALDALTPIATRAKGFELTFTDAEEAVDTIEGLIDI